MRFLLKVNMNVEAGTAAAKAGRLGSIVSSILGDLKPEAAYFVSEGGKRTGLIFLNLDDPSQIPAVAEPFFQAFNAEIELTPAMVAEDLAKAQPAIAEAARKFG